MSQRAAIRNRKRRKKGIDRNGRRLHSARKIKADTRRLTA